ncbi:MAG: hypothetical protein WBG86_14455 [Polyangiales bacterium]
MALANLPNYRASGSYAPSVVTVANLSAATLVGGMFWSIGNVVNARALIDLDPIAAGQCSFRLSLPIGRQIAAEVDILGSGGVKDQGSIGWGLTVVGDPATNEALANFESSSTTAGQVVVDFAYIMP